MLLITDMHVFVKSISVMGKKSMVCGCIEVHSMFYYSVNDPKVAGLIGSAAHHYG